MKKDCNQGHTFGSYGRRGDGGICHVCSRCGHHRLVPHALERAEAVEALLKIDMEKLASRNRRAPIGARR